MDGFRTIKKVCLFCGKERDVLIYETNGIDDRTGRQKCNPRRNELGDGCTCPLGKIRHKRQEIKMMCYNCKFYIPQNCTNKNMMNEASTFFQMPDKLKVIHPEKHCKYWGVSPDILKNLIKENEED